MAYNQELADIIRTHLTTDKKVEEKAMMGGLTFMVDHKMCVGIIKDDLMVRIDPLVEAEALEQPNAKPMDFTGRPMKGYIQVNPDGWSDTRQLNYWLDLALQFNPKAKSSKKK